MKRAHSKLTVDIILVPKIQKLLTFSVSEFISGNRKNKKNFADGRMMPKVVAKVKSNVSS